MQEQVFLATVLELYDIMDDSLRFKQKKAMLSLNQHLILIQILEKIIVGWCPMNFVKKISLKQCHG